MRSRLHGAGFILGLFALHSSVFHDQRPDQPGPNNSIRLLGRGGEDGRLRICHVSQYIYVYHTLTKAKNNLCSLFQSVSSLLLRLAAPARLVGVHAALDRHDQPRGRRSSGKPDGRRPQSSPVWQWF